MKKILPLFFVIFLWIPVQAQEDDETTDPLTQAARAMNQRRFTEAEKIYASLLLKTPQDVALQQLWVHALINLKRHDEADSMLRRMTDRDTNEGGNYWYRGLNFERQQKDSLAIGFFKLYIAKAGHKNGFNISAWLHAGSGFRRMMHKDGISNRQVEEMVYLFEQYIGLNPTDPYNTELEYFITEVKSRKPSSGRLVWDETN
ncbi:MAG: tetratricopeptide repeat protein [Bacteroidia bacterium]|nr:tetratricopeptide repeat protein [Bacteroidia bacterium]